MDRSEYEFVGAFSPREIKRVTHYLEVEEVDYEVEFDDSEVKDHSLVSFYGFGPGVQVNLYIDPRKKIEYDAIIETLYPP